MISMIAQLVRRIGFLMPQMILTKMVVRTFLQKTWMMTMMVSLMWMITVKEAHQQQLTMMVMVARGSMILIGTMMDVITKQTIALLEY